MLTNGPTNGAEKDLKELIQQINSHVTNIQVKNVARFESLESRPASTVDVQDQEETGSPKRGVLFNV